MDIKIARTKISTVILVVALVVAMIPASVAAQNVPKSVFLDQDTRSIATVTVDGQTYQVYHHDNLVPWATGIEIYTNGQLVESESTARTVLTAVAQRRAAEELGPEEAQVFLSSAENVNETAANVSEAATSINDSVTYLAALRQNGNESSTGYNETVEAAPRINEYNETAHELLPQLRSFESDSTAYSRNATKLAALIERRENGTTVDPQRLYARYSATLEAMNQVSDHLDFSGISEPLGTVATQSDAIAENASSVPDHGEELERRFRSVHNTSSVAANGTDALEVPGFEVEDAQDTAQSLQSDWMEQWETRRNAAMDVYKTIVGVFVAILLIGGYVWWRRR